jgi:hypothetical protein
MSDLLYGGSYIGYDSKYPRVSIVKNNLQLHIDASDSSCYPGSGSVCYDLSANKRNGTMYSGVSYNPDGYFSFDNTTSAYIDFPLVTAAKTNVTMQALVKIPLSEGGTIFFNGGSTGYGVGVGTDYFDTAGNDVLGLFQQVRWIDTNIKYGSRWVMVTFRLDASSAPSFFKNKTFLGTFNGTAPLTPTVRTTLGSDMGPSRNFSGSIAWAAFYTSFLSESEVSQNFDAIRAKFLI